MKRLAAILGLCILFSTAFVAEKGGHRRSLSADTLPTEECPDSLRNVCLYTEALKQNLIAGDSVRARQLFEQAIASDPSFAPAYYGLGGLLLYADTPQAVALSRRAAEIDTLNTWYLELYGQALLVAHQYDEALGIYRRLSRITPKNPDIYRILAVLYEQAKLPFSAIAVLDSAELRFGRIPELSMGKQRLLISTRQYDKAIDETKALVEAAPYEAANHVMLGELYGILGRDSLALSEFDNAMRIDSTDLDMLVTMADFYNRRQNHRGLLRVTRRLFESDELPVRSKAEQFERLTSDTRFYREYFLQLNELASTLAIKYPNDQKIVELYGKHLIASGELDLALNLYKHHTTTRPPIKEFFTMVIDIESYKQRPDSVEKYVGEAIRLFPDVPEFYISRGHIHSYGKRYNEAIRSYRSSLRHARTDSLRGVVWGYIGDTFHAAGESKKSFKAYDKSLAYYRDNASVLNNYAYFLAEQQRNLEQALEMSGRALALAGNNPTYLDTHAWVLFGLGRMGEAKKSIQLAVSLDRNNSPELMLHYGDILAASGEKYMAEVYWRKALENGYADPAAITRRFESLQKSNPEKPAAP